MALMKQKPNHTRFSARLPERLSERLQEEASRRFCSASDIVRMSLVHFFERDCQTKQDDKTNQEVLV
jgi:Arc/MetJ-type ribon-helix-helix transcriptional regulator